MDKTENGEGYLDLIDTAEEVVDEVEKEEAQPKAENVMGVGLPETDFLTFDMPSLDLDIPNPDLNCKI